MRELITFPCFHTETRSQFSNCEMQTEANVRPVVAGDVVSGENRYNPYSPSAIARYRRRHNEAITESRVYGHRRSVSAIKNRACVYVKSFNVSLFTVARYTLIFPQQIRLPLFFQTTPFRCKSPPATTRLPLYIRDISYAGRSHGKNANFRCRPQQSPAVSLILFTRPPSPSPFYTILSLVWWPYGITSPFYNGISSALVLNSDAKREWGRKREKQRERKRERESAGDTRGGGL